jgi:hypothetical protein
MVTSLPARIDMGRLPVPTQVSVAGTLKSPAIRNWATPSTTDAVNGTP